MKSISHLKKINYFIRGTQIFWLDNDSSKKKYNSVIQRATKSSRANAGQQWMIDDSQVNKN